MKFKKRYFLLLPFLFLLPFGFMEVREIDIQGNKEEFITTQEIEHSLFSKKYAKNVLWIFLRDRFGIRENVPFVESYSIRWNAIDSISVQIRNEPVIGYVEYMGSNLYFDKDGMILESSLKELEGVIRVDGLKLGSVCLQEKLVVMQEYSLERVLKIVRDIREYGIEADSIVYKFISARPILKGEAESKEETSTEKNSEEVQEPEKAQEAKPDMDIEDDLVIHIRDIVVQCGDADNIDGKLQELKGMLSSMDGLKGVLHMEKCDQEDNNGIYTLDRE